MTDEQHAEEIHELVGQLRLAISKAREAGLSVEPLLRSTELWLAQISPTLSISRIL